MKSARLYFRWPRHITVMLHGCSTCVEIELFQQNTGMSCVCWGLCTVAWWGQSLCNQDLFHLRRNAPPDDKDQAPSSKTFKSGPVLPSCTHYIIEVNIKQRQWMSCPVWYWLLLIWEDRNWEMSGHLSCWLTAGEKFNILLFSLRLEKHLWKSLCSPEIEQQACDTGCLWLKYSQRTRKMSDWDRESRSPQRSQRA